MTDLPMIENRLDLALNQIEALLVSRDTAGSDAQLADVRHQLMQSQAQVTQQSTQIDDLTKANRDAAQELEQLRTSVMALEKGMEQMRQSNADLQTALDQAAAGQTGADETLKSQVKAMQADRIAEQAEIAALLVALGPLVEGSKDA